MDGSLQKTPFVQIYLDLIEAGLNTQQLVS